MPVSKHGTVHGYGEVCSVLHLNLLDIIIQLTVEGSVCLVEFQCVIPSLVVEKEKRNEVPYKLEESE